MSTDASFTGYNTPPGIMGNDPFPAPVLPTRIDGLIAGQIHFPPHLPGNPANPLLVVTAGWRPDDFTPRFVDISVEAISQFSVHKSYAGNPRGETNILDRIPGTLRIYVVGECYADCDASTGVGALDIFDFLCFQNLYAAGHAYACDCDTGSGPGVCDIFDFLCFQNEFAGGCP